MRHITGPFAFSKRHTGDGLAQYAWGQVGVPLRRPAAGVPGEDLHRAQGHPGLNQVRPA